MINVSERLRRASSFLISDTCTGEDDTEKYLQPQNLMKLGHNSVTQEDSMEFNAGARSARFLVSFMVDARGGSMRGSRHNGMRIIIPPRKCPAPTQVTCRFSKRQCLPYPPPLVEGEGLVSRLVEMGPARTHFLGPVIVEIPHFGSICGKERELIVLRSDNGDTWKEHHYDCCAEDLVALLNGMNEELDSPVELEKKHICRIITKDFPQYFAVVSRIKQESEYIGPEGGVLTSKSVPMVRAAFPPGALTKKIRVGLQAQPVPEEIVRGVIDKQAFFSPIVIVEPRRRKFHKPITITIPVPPRAKDVTTKGCKGDPVPCLRLLCSITGGTCPAQWEDITGTTSLSFVTDCVSFTTNVSARFWLANCYQVNDTVVMATPVYKELICVPYLAKFVVFAKPLDLAVVQLRCFCITDDKVDKTLEQQENFEEVARSKDIEVSEGTPIYVQCYGNLSPVSKINQKLVFTFYAFKENRLPFTVKVLDIGQEPYGKLSFLKDLKSTKGFPQRVICNLNFTLPAHKKKLERGPDDKNVKNQRHIIASLALRQRFNSLCDPTSNKAERGKIALKTSKTSGYSYKPACTTQQYQAWVTSPTASAHAQAMSGFVSLCSSSSNTPSASPLRSLLSKHSDTKFDIRSSFMPSFKSASDVGLPVSSYTAVSSSQKTMEQQAQYPVLASLTTSSSLTNVPDSVSVNAFPLSSARTSQPTAEGSPLQESFITMTPPALPKSSLNMSSSNFSYKSVNVSNAPIIGSPIKTLPVLTPMRTKTNTSSFHSSPTKCHDPYPSLQERIQSTTISATTSVNDAFDDVASTLNFEKLKTVPISTPSSYQPIQSSSSVYDFRRSSLSFTTSVTYSTVAVPVYSVINVSPEQQFKKLPDISKSTAACLSSKKSVVSEEDAQVPSNFARVVSPDKTLAFIPPGTSSSTLSNRQEILKDVHEMKKNIIGKSAVLQTDTCSVSKGFLSDSHKEHKIEGKEQCKIMEKGKQDLVKVSEILNNNIMKEGKKCKKDSKAEDLQDDTHKNQQNRWWCPPRYETVAPQVKTRVMTHSDFNLAKVVDYLTNDIGTNSLSKSVTAAQTNEETRKKREEKPKHVSKHATAVHECKFKTAPLTIHPSQSEKELSRLTDTLFGTETILDSDDIFHDQDKSPLSDSGFETRSERTPSVPQSTDSMGSRSASQKISPVITETWTETVQVIRSYKSSGDTNEPRVDEVKIANSPAQCTDIEFRLLSGSNKDRVKMYQARSTPENDITYKGMRLKEETHITTTTRMLYYKPARNEKTSEIFKRTTMKSLQPDQDSSREFTGLYEHENGNKGWQEPHDTMPKVEHIIEVHIEKENKTDPTEIIITETKNHPEKEIYVYQCSNSKNGLQNREQVEKVISAFLQEDDERITTVQLKIEDLHKTVKLQRPHSVESHENDSSIIKREPTKITVKKLFTEKYDSSCTGSDKALTESSYYFERGTNDGSMRHVILKPDNSGGVIDDNETHDNVSLLQYAADPASPKKSIWTRVPDDRQRESTDKKNRFEDRVDKTVKEAEEKLSETSLFFRNKTKKVNDELQSPEEKKQRPNIRAVPSSTCSSPGKNVLRNGGGREEWSRERFRDRYNPYERKCASLPSSPKGCVLLQYCDNSKQGGYSSKSFKCFQPSTSKFSFVSMKIQDKAIMKDQMSQYSQTAGALVKKLQENELPIYQVFAGDSLPNLSGSGEHCPKDVLDSEVRQGYNITKAQLFNVCDTTLKYDKTLYSKDKVDTTLGSCVSGYPKSQTPQIFPNFEKGTLVYCDGIDKPIKNETTKKITSVQPDATGSHIPSIARSNHCSCDVNNKFGDMCSLGSINVVCNNESVTTDIKPLPIYVKLPVGKKYEKETDTSRPRTYNKAVSHVNQAMHEAREEVYTSQMIKKNSSSQVNPNNIQVHINVTDFSGGSSNTLETSHSEEVNYDLNNDLKSDSLVGTPSSFVEHPEEEDLPKTIIFRELSAEKSKAVTPTELSKGTHGSPGKQDKAKQVPLNTQQSDQLELKKGSPPSEANTKMIEVNLQEEHDRHLFAEPVIQIHLPSPLQSGADDIDSSDDESVIELVPLKKYKFKMSRNGEKCNKPRNPDRNDSHHNESQSINGVIQVDEEDEQNDNDQSVTDCSIATTAEFSHDTDATEIDSLDGYDLQDEDDGLNDTKTLSLSNEEKTRNPYFGQTQLEFKKELTPNEHSEEKTKSKSNLYKKNESGKDQCKIYSLEGRHPDRQEFSDKYFSYKLEAELPSTYKTIVTKDSDLDPWSNKRKEEEVVETKSKDEDPKPFGLLIEDKSQATTPDSTLARTPTDDSTPTSEPNPFPFHEGKMFEMTRSGAIDMSKQDFVEERLQFFQIGPQSPCERTDLRIAIVADHLGLSWTELAREMNFSVDEINHIRTENPNSLTAQSFMLLKKWVSRDGKDATTDALTAGLTKVNRMDIVTLLEGPIFDYGIISGTRSFADDSGVKKEDGKV